MQFVAFSYSRGSTGLFQEGGEGRLSAEEQKPENPRHQRCCTCLGSPSEPNLAGVSTATAGVKASESRSVLDVESATSLFADLF